MYIYIQKSIYKLNYILKNIITKKKYNVYYIMFNDKLLLYSVAVGVIINLVLPQVLLPFATPEEIKPPNGATLLSFKKQLMHMFVHHAQVPITSSIIVAIIVLLSILVSRFLMTVF